MSALVILLPKVRAAPTGDEYTHKLCSPCLIEQPALGQTDVSYLCNVMPPARNAVAGRWTGHVLPHCDLNESLKIGNKNGYSKKAAEGICKHRGILCSSAFLSFNSHTVIRNITRTTIL